MNVSKYSWLTDVHDIQRSSLKL